MLGKQVVRCSDRSGFVVNALLVPYLLSAIRMVEAGFATVEDVDKAVVAGLSHPMGPLRLSDLVGLDTVKLIADKMFEEFKEPLYAPPPLLLRMVEAGQLGKKSGPGLLLVLIVPRLTRSDVRPTGQRAASSPLRRRNRLAAKTSRAPRAPRSAAR